MAFRLGALEFTWDPVKSETNIRKHGITFEEAATPRRPATKDEPEAPKEPEYVQ